MPLSPTYAMVTPLQPTPPMATPLYPSPPLVTSLQPTHSTATLLQPTTPVPTPLYPAPPILTPLQPTLGNVNSLRAPLQSSTAVLAVPHATGGTGPMMAIPTSGMIHQSPNVQMTPAIPMTNPLSQGQSAFQASSIPGSQMTYSQLPSSTLNPRILPSQMATPPLQVLPLPSFAVAFCSSPYTSPVVSNSALGNTAALPQFSASTPTRY